MLFVRLRHSARVPLNGNMKYEPWRMVNIQVAGAELTGETVGGRWMRLCHPPVGKVTKMLSAAALAHAYIAYVGAMCC